MSYSNKTQQLLDKLQLEHPLIQAPMAGVSNPALAAAVAGAGALGSLGLGAGSPAGIERALEKLAGLTNRPVNFNFFCHAQPGKNPQRETRWLTRMAPLFEELDAPVPTTMNAPYGSFDDHPETLHALLDNNATVVSFHFGLPGAKTVSALKAQGCFLLSSATSVAEAKWLEANGADAIIAQGWEAGGHRGRFVTTHNDEQLGTLALVPRIVAAVDTPVIAAGGINTGASAHAALTLGAAAAQLGTAYITCPESSAGAAYRAALAEPERQTLMTPVFSGRPARGLENRVTSSLQAFGDETPDYPVTYETGKTLAAIAAQTKDQKITQDYAAMWAGQGFRGNRVMPATELTTLIAQELTAHG